MAKYVRKTRDAYILLGNYGYGWDEILEAENRQDLKTQLKTYQENVKDAVFKTKIKRVKIDQEV